MRFDKGATPDNLYIIIFRALNQKSSFYTFNIFGNARSGINHALSLRGLVGMNFDISWATFVAVIFAENIPFAVFVLHICISVFLLNVRSLETFGHPIFL